MTRGWVWSMSLLIAAGASSCGDSRRFVVSDGGDGTDADTDTDTDTDPDSDADGDSGVDSGTDTDPDVDAGSDSGTSDGACMNADDLAILAEGTVRDLVLQCALACAQSEGIVTAGCVTICVRQATELSDGCSSCFGELGLCAANNCAIECFGEPGSEACDACIVTACDPAFGECSGLPA